MRAAGAALREKTRIDVYVVLLIFASTAAKRHQSGPRVVDRRAAARRVATTRTGRRMSTVATPSLDDLWLVIRALHRDLDAMNGRIRALEAALMPLVREEKVLRIANEAEPPGWVSPSAAPAQRSDRVWRSASGS